MTECRHTKGLWAQECESHRCRAMGHCSEPSAEELLAAFKRDRQDRGEAAPSYKYTCPTCGTALEVVRQSPNSMLNSEQFDAVKLGDWFCRKCPPDEGARFHYLWDRDLAAPSEPEAQKVVADDWRVGEFISSARRPEHVLMLAVGAKQIAEYGAHRDFVRWVSSPSPAASMEMQGQPLTDEEITPIHYRAVDKCPGAEGRSFYVAREVERTLAAKNGWRLGEGQ